MADAVYTLKNPLKWGDDEVTQLVFKNRLTIADLEDAADHANKLRQTRVMIARATGRPEDLIKSLDQAEIDGLGEVLNNFMNRSGPTGETGSPISPGSIVFSPQS